jgi:hypothetical protein
VISGQAPLGLPLVTALADFPRSIGAAGVLLDGVREALSVLGAENASLVRDDASPSKLLSLSQRSDASRASRSVTGSLQAKRSQT